MPAGAIVKWFGLGLMAAGVISSWIALWHLAPGRSRSRAYMSGIFQSRTDYTSHGWRSSVWGRLLTAAGFLTAAFGVIVLGGE
jgi:hypothetical protein